jgi:hypothetical protein
VWSTAFSLGHVFGPRQETVDRRVPAPARMPDAFRYTRESGGAAGRRLEDLAGGRDLPANPEGARRRSNLHRDSAGIVPQHTLREGERGPRCRPIRIIDEAVDPNVRPGSNIKRGLIQKLEICASLLVGVHEIVL